MKKLIMTRIFKKIANFFPENGSKSLTLTLGGVNRGFYQLMQELPQERLGLAVSSAAACEWMFEETRYLSYQMLRILVYIYL
jgi:hypothetical protein